VQSAGDARDRWFGADPAALTGADVASGIRLVITEFRGPLQRGPGPEQLRLGVTQWIYEVPLDTGNRSYSIYLGSCS
jgi:hypothetical protein